GTTRFNNGETHQVFEAQQSLLCNRLLTGYRQFGHHMNRLELVGQLHQTSSYLQHMVEVRAGRS
ncbi:hypothetical protein KUCAC02_022848, partial [Chaenocephalus aceratus]